MKEVLIYQIPEHDEIRLSPEGNREKTVLVLVWREQYDVHLRLLENIIQAIGLTVEKDVHIEPMIKDARISFNDLLTSSGVLKIISFGIPASMMHLELPDVKHKLWHFEAFDLLITHDLEKLSRDKHAKLELWKDLKHSFAA